jgi:hypothetical protein
MLFFVITVLVCSFTESLDEFRASKKSKAIPVTGRGGL